METALLQRAVLSRVELEELRGPGRSAAALLRERNDQAGGEQLLAEVALVHFALQHGFVEMLELRERELRRQQLEADRLISHLAAQPLHRGGEDGRVIEGQPR